jgi:hypothetical protein
MFIQIPACLLRNLLIFEFAWNMMSFAGKEVFDENAAIFLYCARISC